MNVSSVKNLNGETFSAVQDAALTDVVQTNSGVWNDVSAYQTNSATINDTVSNVTTNSGAWGGTSLNISAGPGVNITLVDNTIVFSNDETVIYDGKLPNLSSDLTLAESWDNFKMIRVRGGDNTPEDHYYSNVSPSRPAFKISWAYNWMNEGYLKFSPTDDPRVWTYASNTYVHYTHNTSAVTVTQNDTSTLGSSCNFKIIGINRINNA